MMNSTHSVDFKFGCESASLKIPCKASSTGKKVYNNRFYLPKFLPNHFNNAQRHTKLDNLTCHNRKPKKIKKTTESLYKDHLADLLISCDGSCGSELALILHCCKHVIESGNYSDYPKDCKLCEQAQTEIDYSNVIERYFFNHDDPHRQCLINNFEKFGCIANNNFENGFESIYHQLNDENNFIIGEIKAKSLISFFYDLLYFNFDAILNKLANLGCRRNAVTLREEIENGIGINHPYLNGKLLSNKIENIRKTQAQANGLTNDEILALYAYTAIDELSGKFRESHRAQETCKFKKLFENITRAVLKINQYNEKNNYHIPDQFTLYHGTSIPMKLDENSNNKYQWSFQTITSFTSNMNIALGFGAKNNDGNVVTLLKIENVKQKIRNRELIAVDISWISEWSKEDEWIVLPVQLFSDKNHFGSKTYATLDNKTLNLHIITQCKTHNIEYIVDTDSEKKLPLLAKYISPSLRDSIRNILITFVFTVGLFYKHKCDHCNVSSHCVLWNGSLLYNTVECPACRKINFGAFERRNEKVKCYSCKNKYFRDQFIDSPPNINTCKQCKKLKRLCQECKNRGKLCPNKQCLALQVDAKKDYMLNDKIFATKLDNGVLQIASKTVTKYGLVFDSGRNKDPDNWTSKEYLVVLKHCLETQNVTFLTTFKFLLLHSRYFCTRTCAIICSFFAPVDELSNGNQTK